MTSVVVGTGTGGTVVATEMGRRGVWGAVLAGALVTVAIHVMLDLLGLAIGLGTLPTDGVVDASHAPRAVGIATAVWWLATTIVAVGAGAMVTARLTDTGRTRQGAVLGLSSWATSSALWLLATMTLLAGTLAGPFGTLGQSVDYLELRRGSPAAPDGIETNRPARPDGRTSADGVRAVSPDEARVAAKTASAAALWGFLGLLLSAAAGCGGGILGAKACQRVVTADRDERDREPRSAP